MRDRTPKAGVYTDGFPRRSGRLKYYAYLGTYVLFMQQSVVILSLYNGAIQWLMEAGWEGSAISNHSHWEIYVSNPWWPIHIFHGFASKMIFYTNRTIFSIGHLLIDDVTSLIRFNLLKLETNKQHRLIPVNTVMNNVIQLLSSDIVNIFFNQKE